MADQLITVDISQIRRYSRKDLKRMRGMFHAAKRNLLNNMAFGVRRTAIEWGIPRAMTVRSPGIIKRTLTVDKARRGTETATLGQSRQGGTWTGLRAQEFGGRMGQQPATKAARAGNLRKKITPRARLKGNVLTPDDISVAYEKNQEHRIAVFLDRLQRPGGIEGGSKYYKRPFVVGSTGGFYAGLKKLGKRINDPRKASRGSAKRGRRGKRVSKRFQTKRQLITLRTFNKRQVRVRRERWLRPSIDRYLRTVSPKIAWRDAVKAAKRFSR